MKRSTAQLGSFSLQLVLCSAAVCSMITGTLLAFFHPEAPGKASHPAGAGLTFAERIAYERAIEEVYWRHRIWPKENPDPKPSLDAVITQAQLEKEVEDYLRKSQALEDHWQQPITAEQLQAEMDRMAQHTRQPVVLREIFAALGNDPFVIAECLARAALSDRLVTDLSAHDQEPLASWRAVAEDHIPKVMASANYTLPNISDGSGCMDDTWTDISTVNAPSARAFHTAVWTGSEMIVWGGLDDSNVLNTGGRYNPATDNWTATQHPNGLDGRYYHTAVWTGSDMIIWGGLDDHINVGDDGERYNPNTDSWAAIAPGPLDPRYLHTAVWTGSEMIIWGGYWIGGPLYRDGARFPSWTPVSLTHAPTGRYAHAAFWTGSEMIVWGGSNADGTGGRYNPSTDSWIATSTTNAPTVSNHTTVWTGSEMIVWGGFNYPNVVNTGGRYDPGTDSWTATTTNNAPQARWFHTAVWTDSQMIVWGGCFGNPCSNFVDTGGRYDPGTDSWTATSTTNAPSARAYHTAVWTGSEMIVWGGQDGSGNNLNTGGRYCAQSGAPSPTPTATPCAGAWSEQSPYPIAVSGHAVASQGGNLYSFGGIANNTAIANAYKYTPATNTWMPIASLPAPRGWFSASSDGTYIYLLGGVDQNFNTTGTLWRYDPISNTYNTSLPSYTIPTYFHASAYLNGKIYRIAGRAIGTDFHVEVYNIATNTWSMAANYPFANHSLMAVALGSYIYAGGGNASPDKTWRYDPSTDSWDDAAIADLPEGRSAAASGAYNGRWLLAGGDVNFAISTSAIAWDSATNTWSNLPNMVQARDYLAGATAVQSFHAVAGNSAPGTPTNDNQQYTETCDTPTPTATPTITPVACSLFENFDFVSPPALPVGWTATNGINPDGILWQTSNSGLPSPPADSPPNAAWVNDPAAISDKYLDSPPIIINQLENAGLMFRNNYSLEPSRDGGVLEVSIDGGPFQDILAAGGFFGQGGYNGTISACCGNPLAGRNAWTGSSGGFIETDVSLPFSGHTIVLRWRMGSDSSGSGQGWRVDSVMIVCERPTPTPTATSTPMVTATPTVTATATTSATPTSTATATPTSTATPSATATPTARPTPTPRFAPTPRPRPTPAPRP